MPRFTQMDVLWKALWMKSTTGVFGEMKNSFT